MRDAAGRTLARERSRIAGRDRRGIEDGGWELGNAIEGAGPRDLRLGMRD